MKCKKIYNRQSRRLFLYNTCLVVCGISMAMTNYFQPLMAAMASYNCSSVTNLTSVSSTSLSDSSPDIPWACDPYNGQLMYAFLYGITSAAYVLLTTLVLADLLGADKFTNAFGLLSSGVLMKIPEIAVKLLKFQDQKEKERNSTFVPKERGSYLDDPTYDWTDYID